MGKYYSSSEETWNKETTAQEKIADGISKLYQINNALDRGFDELKSDKYGLMSNNSYDNFSYQIVQCGEKNHALSQYSKEIHGILKEKEISFCKGISKVIEEMSLLEITEYTTENTLGITERKNVPTAYYNGSMAYQAGMPISYQVKDVPKGKINILDIQMKTDIMGIEEQLEAYLKEEKGNLTDAELVELKEEYYQQYLQTSFEHEVYTDGWLKNLSTTLDYIPIVGGVKNAIEGLCGYTMTGEKLTTQERISYTALGILTTAVDVFTLGTASGLIQGGKFVGKELAKSGIKKLGKYAIMDSVSSVTMGWGSQFAGEKLRDFGLSAEGIFAIHLIAGIATAKMGKYKANKDLKKLASEVGLDVDQLNDVLKYTGMSGDELEKALKSTSLENILGISDKNLEYLKKQTNLSTDTILNELKKQGLSIEDVNPSNVDDVINNFNRDSAYDVIKGIENGEITLITNKQKGNFGEMVQDNFYEGPDKNLNRISKDRVTSLDDAIHRGIDGVYEDPTGGPPKFVISEAKYGTSKLSILKDGTPQMSDKWISDRLDDAVGVEKAKEIRFEMMLNPDNVQCTLINVDSKGNVVESILKNGKKLKGN